MLLLAPAPVRAATVVTAEVLHAQGRYTIYFEVLIQADRDRARALMADYRSWPRLSRSLRSSELLARTQDGTEVVRTVYRPCILFICKTVVHVRRIRQEAGGDIVTVGVPESSDFESVTERWRILAHRHGTRVIYTGQLAPKFFVPPWFGPYLLGRTIRKELEYATARLEALARDEDAADEKE